jgi:uncharacterized phage infection (PIP) family protein YhgE
MINSSEPGIKRGEKMSNTMTIVLVLLTLSAVGAAGFAVAMLSKVKRGLSDLGMRVLESQDIGKIKAAANKTDTFESRLAGFEQKAEESKNQFNEQKTKLDDLAGKFGAYEQQIGASEQKIGAFDARFNELSTKLESVEQKTSKNESDLAQTVPNIKALADEIQNLKVFQAATEKIRGQILGAFNDIQAGMPSNEGFVDQPKIPTPEEATSESSTPEETPTENSTPENSTPEDSKPDDAVKELEDWQREDNPDKEDNPNRVTGSRRWLS